MTPHTPEFRMALGDAYLHEKWPSPFHIFPINRITRSFNYVCWTEINYSLQMTGLITVG